MYVGKNLDRRRFLRNTVIALTATRLASLPSMQAQFEQIRELLSLSGATQWVNSLPLPSEPDCDRRSQRMCHRANLAVYNLSQLVASS